MKQRGFEIVSDKHLKSEFKVLPKQGSTKSAGYDFYLPENVTLFPRESSGVIFTNVKAYMKEDEVLQLHIRSSIGIKKKIILANVTGIIDSDYYNNPDNDGNIGVVLVNNSNHVQTLEAGDRIMQGIFQKFLPSDNCNALETEKRTGGYGSTGKK